MTILNTLLPFISSLLSFVFAFVILKRYRERRGPHQLLWGIGMVFYGIGGFCEAYYGAIGWSPFIFRLWYLCGAILVAAWLGQGTVYLLAKRRWAHILMVLAGSGLALCSGTRFCCGTGSNQDDNQSAHGQRA